MPKGLWWYLAVINALAFLITAVDKWLAKRGAWRVSERTLLFLAAIGGAGGTLLAMELCRHKTQKPLFFIGVPLLLILWMATLVLLHK